MLSYASAMLISEIYHRNVKTVRPETLIGEVIKRMREEETNGFVVTNAAGDALGIIALQDIAAATIPKEFRENRGMAQAMYRRGYFHESCKEIKKQKASALMRTDFVSVDLETNIMAITSDFLEHDLYIVPVIEKGKLLGIITRSEIKQALAIGMGIAA